ncbi:MAG: hypothetical protein CVU81_02650 [Euryarchaeota archaeon HGW-Euryarchaeota-1]|nr:MAG: hypothetical protein CVU81_02650 [Euryarchaeota archaeon HGW-Euryarchaeota-1]
MKGVYLVRQSKKDVLYYIEIVIFYFSCSNAWLMISSGISSLKTSHKQTFSSVKQNSSKRLGRATLILS